MITSHTYVTFGKPKVFGAKPTLAQSTRAVIAFGGLQDCCVQFPDAPHAQLREKSVAAALDALGR
jgi:hypothetical protein